MSLTRKEWEEMWERTHRMELYAHNIAPHTGHKKALLAYLRFVKDKIQQVIGQME